MVDVVTSIVMSLALNFCANGEYINKENRCNDESEIHKNEIAFGVRHPDGEYNTLEITEDGHVKFIIHQDGSVTKDDDYNPDPMVMKFWQTMQKQYDICKFEDSKNIINTDQKFKLLFRPKRKNN